MKEPFVILVDENDNQTGVAGKMDAHQKGLLHRAVSVFVINSHGNWILQRRALDKYHSNGLWTNTCCTHPHPGEMDIEAAGRRLREEMGIECRLIELFSFIYMEKLDNDLTEHELDHVFFGVTDDVPVINAIEVEEWKAVTFNDLSEDIIKNPENYTYWFKEIYEKVNLHILKTQNNIL
jgi:isopentenyl-diphosphate delta-isomerase